MMEAEPYMNYADEVPDVLTNDGSSINACDSPSSSLMLSAMRPRDHETMSKTRILRNLIMMSASCFLFFLAFQSLQNLQSTMNSDNGIGMQSQSVIYAASMLSSLFLPDLLIKTFGAKRSLIFMIILGLPYLAANYSPTYEIIMPSAFLIGIAIGPFSATLAYYANEMALRYFKMSKSESLESVLARFYGVISFFLENTQIWGNLASYYVLRPGMIPVLNQTTNLTCGIEFNHEDSHNPNLEPPSEDKRIMLVSIYLTSAVVAAVLMGLFMDKLENDIEVNRTEGNCKFIANRLVAAIKQACLPDQILLIPLTVYVGMELAFYTGDITEAYIACSWGVHHVGLVTVCFGVCGAVTALFVGPMVKYLSQMTVMILAAFSNAAICIFLFLWKPSPASLPKYFLVAGFWGMGDALWWSQVTALYGLMFPNNKGAAFSNFCFWSFLGAFLCFSFNNYFSEADKIKIFFSALIFGMLCYLIGQAKLRYFRRRQYVSLTEDA